MNSNHEDDLWPHLVNTLKAAGLSQTAEAEAGHILDSAPRDANDSKCLALASLDADGIQKMLLASPRPVTIFGASYHLSQWDRDIRDSHHGLAEAGAMVIFSGGGNALLLVPRQEIEVLLKSLRQKFKAAVHGSLSTAWIPVSPKELANPQQAKDAPGLPLALGPRGFPDLIHTLQFSLRKDKLAADRDHPFLTATPSADDELRCSECTIRPRAEALRCAACAANRDRGGKLRRATAQARSFADLFAHSRRIAYIYIDGRRISKLLAGAKSLRDYHQISKALHHAFDFTGLRQDLKLPVDDSADSITVPSHQLILSGGDDLLLVVPASRPRNVFHLTRDLIAAIKRRFQESLGAGSARQIHVGAGILITKSLAASYACERAGMLCDFAKDNAPIDEESAIAFEILLDGTPIDGSAESEQIAESKQADKEQILRARSYTLAQFERLLATAKLLTQIPPSQLMQLRAAFEGDKGTGLVTLLYQAARHPELRTALFAEGPLAPDQVEKQDFILRRRNDKGIFETALPDLIDITRSLAG